MEISEPASAPWRQRLGEGQVIPALPLMLDSTGEWSQDHQRAVIRYYMDAGAGGLAVGVHSTQFEIRRPEHGLFEPVLRLAAETMETWPSEMGEGFIRIAGICGRTSQATKEAALAKELGYHAGLVSVAAFQEDAEREIVEHCRDVSQVLPVIGFYLQPAVGGRVLGYAFWREFFEIESVVAVKMAPFNRYQTWDVVRALIDSGREDVALYTGNDDNIIVDLLTPFTHAGQTRWIAGGLLGQWGVWTQRAAEMLKEIKAVRGQANQNGGIDPIWLERNMQLTDANAAVFDAAHGFAGCIPGILEVLRRQGLAPSVRCLNPEEKLSLGQSAELDRVTQAYPWLVDDAFVKEHLSQWLAPAERQPSYAQTESS